MYLCRGLTLVITQASPIVLTNDAFKWIGTGSLLGLPVPVYIFIIAAAAGQFILSYTATGRFVLAVGSNEEAARLMGEMLEKRSAIQEAMHDANPDPAALKRMSDEMDEIQERLQMMDDIVQLTQARAEFNGLINQINQVLQFIVTGRMDDGDCTGNCSSCGGCH
jgi:cell fate (sporulation/competence/biofilm development) regulator YlbF (YheA/YmcA/DUF963 family)